MDHFPAWALFRLIYDFGKHLAPESSNVRRWMCTRSGLEKGQRKKRLRDWGGALKVSSADQHQLLKSRNQQILIKMDYWAQAHLFVSAPMLHARGGVAGFVHHSSHAVLGRLLQVLKAPGAPQSPSQRLKGSTPSLGHFLPSRST